MSHNICCTTWTKVSFLCGMFHVKHFLKKRGGGWVDTPNWKRGDAPRPPTKFRRTFSNLRINPASRRHSSAQVIPTFFSDLRYNCCMSEKSSSARKSYWANLSPEERSIRMSSIAKSRQKKMTYKQKRDHALKMVAARTANKKARAMV